MSPEPGVWSAKSDDVFPIPEVCFMSTCGGIGFPIPIVLNGPANNPEPVKGE